MNRALCRYPAEQVYVPEYDSANEEIGARTLSLTADGEHRPTTSFVDAALDPDFPLVVVIVDGVRATAENRVEAELVADLSARTTRATPRI